MATSLGFLAASPAVGFISPSFTKLLRVSFTQDPSNLLCLTLSSSPLKLSLVPLTRPLAPNLLLVASFTQSPVN